RRLLAGDGERRGGDGVVADLRRAGHPAAAEVEDGDGVGVADDVADGVVVDVEAGQVGVALDAALPQVADRVVVDVQARERGRRVRGQDAVGALDRTVDARQVRVVAI